MCLLYRQDCCKAGNKHRIKILLKTWNHGDEMKTPIILELAAFNRVLNEQEREELLAITQKHISILEEEINRIL